MKPRTPRLAEHGFTVPEVLISSTILAALLLGGLTAVRASVTATTASVMTSEAENRVSRGLRGLHQKLRRAGRSTLTTVPPYEKDPVPIEDGVAFDNLSFHMTTGFMFGEVQYEPDLGDPPMTLRLVEDPQNPANGRLVFNDGNADMTLASHVSILVFRKTGNRIDITLGEQLPDEGGVTTFTMTRSIVLRTQ